LAGDEDEPAIFGYGENGKEYYIATLDTANGTIFDIRFPKPHHVQVVRLGTLEDLQPVEEAWIGAL
jgi:hypothetical protein